MWSTRLGFILAAAGSAVGLGNVWKFPYMAGSNGGGAFVLFYLFCSLLVGVPVMLSEWILGKKTRSDPIGSMSLIAKQKNASPTFWGGVGAIGLLGSFMILCFYSVVGGWALIYVFRSITGTFNHMNDMGKIFGDTLASPSILIIGHTVFMAITMIVVARGINKGIEAVSKYMMLGLFGILVVLLGYSVLYADFKKGVDFLFTFDISKIDGKVAIAALGHAFFSLSLGVSMMMIYGSYLGDNVKLFRSSFIVVMIDLIVALVAGLAIFPMVFKFGLEASSGPGLIFVTLPTAFADMAPTTGIIIGALFFILLSFAALTSAFSLLEPSVNTLVNRFNFCRVWATVLATIAIWSVGIIMALSFNVLSDFKVLDLNLFDLFDTVTSKFFLPLNGLAVIIFATWYLSNREVRKELGFNVYDFGIWNALAKYVVPAIIALVFISNL